MSTPNFAYENILVALNDVVGRLADALASDNPRFDRATFFAACGF